MQPFCQMNLAENLTMGNIFYRYYIIYLRALIDKELVHRKFDTFSFVDIHMEFPRFTVYMVFI